MSDLNSETHALLIAEAPQYRCHKIVRALKISEVHDDELIEGQTVVSFEDQEGRYMLDTTKRPQPQAGWYFVIYEDGYTSFSPAEPFEAGYTRIE